MLSRRQLLQSIAYGSLAPLSLAMTACGQREKMALGIHPWVGYESIYLAEELQLLPKGVTLRHVQNNSEKMALLSAGVLDAGCFTLDEVVQARSHGIPLTVVAVFNISAGADVVLVKKDAQGDLVRIGQGVRIGYEANQVGELMLNLLLDHCQLKRSDVILVNLPVGEAQKQAWQQDKVDAMISFEPYASELARDGAQLAYSTRDFPQRIFDVLAVRTDRVPQFSSLLTALLSVHFNTQKRIFSNREDTLYRMAARHHISYDEANKAIMGVIWPDLERNHLLLTQDESFQKALEALNSIMQASGMIVHRQAFSEWMTPRYLPSLHNK